MASYALKMLNNQKACLAMVFMQLLYAGMALLSKAALNEGISSRVFVAYRQATATLTLVPFALTLERTKAPPFSFALFCKIFLLSLCGLTLSMDLYYMALRHTSATFASTSINIIPVMTFVIAILLRIETVNLKAMHGLCKTLGVLLCVGGAMVLSLYTGPPLKLLDWHNQVASAPQPTSFLNSRGEQKKELLEGPLLMFASFIIWSIWFVMQAEMLKAYPVKLRLTILQCFLSSIQSTVIAVAMDRRLDSWRLGWDVQLLSVIYCGIFVSGISYWLQIWCIEKKGPVYVATFSPLSPFITAILSSLIWAEVLYSGSVLGGILIVGGLYSLLWGKSKEKANRSIENIVDTTVATKDKFADVEGG